MTVKITQLSKSNYTVYNGVFRGQTLYVILEGDKLFARYGLESEPGSIEVITNNSFVWEIDSLLMIQSVNQLMADILPYVIQLADLSSTEWDGYQWVGVFEDDEKANEILDRIDEFIEVDNEELPKYDIVSPEYYSVIFNGMSPSEMREYVSGKKYMDDGILFSEDPYQFINFAIGMIASAADEYITAIYNMFSQFMENVKTLDDVDFNNNPNAKTMLNTYDSAIAYYFDVIAEPDKTSYIDLLVYGNKYFNGCIAVLEGDDALQSEDIADICRDYIVDIDEYVSDVPENNSEFDDETDNENEFDIDEEKTDEDSLDINSDESEESEESPNNTLDYGRSTIDRPPYSEWENGTESEEKPINNQLAFPGETSANYGPFNNPLSDSNSENNSITIPEEETEQPNEFWKREGGAKAI